MSKLRAVWTCADPLGSKFEPFFIIKRVSISQFVGTCDSKKRLLRSGCEERFEPAVEIDPKWSVGVPWVITNTVPVGTDLVWINERAVEFVAKLQNLVSKEDNRVAGGRTRVLCCTLRNGDVKFRLRICGEWGDIKVLAGELKEPPIWQVTDRVRVVIDFIGTAVSGMRLGNLRTSCASATGSRYDGMCHLCIAGLLVSVSAIGTATDATTVL